LVTYFVGGAIILKFGKQASGSDMIPNVAIWKELPGNIRVSFKQHS
jgi:hypothetical protein